MAAGTTDAIAAGDPPTATRATRIGILHYDAGFPTADRSRSFTTSSTSYALSWRLQSLMTASANFYECSWIGQRTLRSRVNEVKNESAPSVRFAPAACSPGTAAAAVRA